MVVIIIIFFFCELCNEERIERFEIRKINVSILYPFALFELYHHFYEESITEFIVYFSSSVYTIYAGWTLSLKEKQSI